jgi:hypothetical protein
MAASSKTVGNLSSTFEKADSVGYSSILLFYSSKVVEAFALLVSLPHNTYMIKPLVPKWPTFTDVCKFFPLQQRLLAHRQFMDKIDRTT